MTGYPCFEPNTAILSQIPVFGTLDPWVGTPYMPMWDPSGALSMVFLSHGYEAWPPAASSPCSVRLLAHGYRHLPPRQTCIFGVLARPSACKSGFLDHQKGGFWPRYSGTLGLLWAHKDSGARAQKRVPGCRTVYTCEQWVPEN